MAALPRSSEAMALAVSHSEFDALMQTCAPFERAPHLAVATSGGPDSMALLLLAQRWVKARGGHLAALTVDHGLRPESAQEARQVALWCAGLGIEHRTLRWQPGHLSSGIQSQAREARYRLLSEWCRDQQILHLLAAHQMDDQAETLFFRLARGSQLPGLSCMPAQGLRHGVRLLRPLLPVSKDRLLATLEQAGQDYIEDPSNRDPRYTRSHVRQLLTKGNKAVSLQAAGLTNRLGKIRNIIDNNLADLLASHVSIYPTGHASVQGEAIGAMGKTGAIQLLSVLADTLSGEAYPARSEALARLYDDIIQGMPKRSFAGLLFIRQKNRLLVCREPNALPAAQALPPNTLMRWDNRFDIAWQGENTHPDMTLRPLGDDGIKQLQAQSQKKSVLRLEKPVLRALPSFWHLEELVSVPHIHYRCAAFRRMEFTARFRPAKALAGQAFSAM